MKLDDLKIFKHPAGFQHLELFENGYGISVIPELNVGEDPLYEVAVLTHNEGRHAHQTYETEITDDVIRYCTADDVDTLIGRIRSLPKTE